MMHAAATPDARIDHAFRLAVSRTASPAERRILTELFHDSLKRFGQDPAAAQKLLATGAAPRDPALNATELAAWATVASMVLNLDETISRP
jgi:hypothetical protein